jgi:hypothetical protein
MPYLATPLRAAMAAALVGGVVVATAATAHADPTTTPSTPTTSPMDLNNLAAALSKGYGLNNCTPQNIIKGELASLVCGQSPDANGPVQAKYIMFTNGDNLATVFKNSIKDDVLTACGDQGQSPTSWHQGSSTTNAGSVACGTYQNAAEIIWTNVAKNVLGYIRASNTDVQALFGWWRANG